MNIETAIDNILAVEKGYVDHAADRGGPTNWGVTEVVARQNGYTGSMRDMPQAFARGVYRKRYITEPLFDRVAVLTAPVAMELIDTGVNMGPQVAATFLQRWLNGFNSTGSYYADLFVDGRLGNASLAALGAFLKWRGKEGETALLRALNSIQGTRYLDIAERDRSQRAFLFGWVMNRVEM